jgi:hypothetical protein
MGGSRASKWKQFRNVIILFTVSGFWHGANWTFVLWGLVNGLYFAPSMLLGINRRHLEPIDKKKISPSIKETLQIFFTLCMIYSTYIFFRANNINHSKKYFLGILNNYNLESIPATILDQYGLSIMDLVRVLIFVIIMFLIEWVNRDKDYGLYLNQIKYSKARWTLYFIIIFMILWWGGDQKVFIYFQF